MIQLETQHWHVAVTYPAYRHGVEEQPFEDVDSALDYARQTRDTLQSDGHRVTEVDSPEDDVAGVIQSYHASEAAGATVAIVQVRACHREWCRLTRPNFFRRTQAQRPREHRRRR